MGFLASLALGLSAALLPAPGSHLHAMSAPSPASDLVLGNALVEFTFETTATTLRLKSVRNVATGFVFTQASPNLWSVNLEGLDGVKRTIHAGSVTGHTLSVQFVAGYHLVALWSKVPVGADKYNVYVVVELNGDTADFWIAVQSNRKNHRVALVTFPRLELDPVADPALFAPVRQGALTRDPHTITRRDVFYPGGTLNTGSMQVFAYCDEAERQVLYLQTKDLENYYKTVTLEARSGRLAIDFQATPVNALTYGNGYQSPYAVAISPMEGRWTEALTRYRQWVVGAPWVERGTLEERGDPTVTQSPFYMFARFCEDVPFDCDPNDPSTIDGLAETLIQWKEYLGVDPSVPVPALWWMYDFTTDSQGKKERYPNVIVYPGIADAIATAAAYGGRIAPHWDTVGWTYQSDSYFAQNVEQFMLRKKNGQVLVTTDGFAVPEQWFAAFRAIHQNALATRILEDGLSGIYYDVLSGFAPLPDYNAGLPTQGGGTYWGDGSKSLFEEHKSLFPGSFVMSEYLNEIYADLIDIPQNNTSQENAGWFKSDSWVLVPGYAMVYHEYQRQPPSIGMQLIDAAEVVRVGFYYYAYNFSIGAMMAISATSQSPCYATDPALDPGGAEVFAFQRTMIQHHLRFLDYLATGELIRPLEVQTDYVTRQEIFSPAGACSDGGCFPQYDSGTGLGVSKVFATAYRSTASNGILITTCNWWDDPAPASILIDVAELGLDDSVNYDLYDVTTTTSQLIGTFPPQFSLDDAAFPGRSVRLYKLVATGTPP